MLGIPRDKRILWRKRLAIIPRKFIAIWASVRSRYINLLLSLSCMSGAQPDGRCVRRRRTLRGGRRRVLNRPVGVRLVGDSEVWSALGKDTFWLTSYGRWLYSPVHLVCAQLLLKSADCCLDRRGAFKFPHRCWIDINGCVNRQLLGYPLTALRTTIRRYRHDRAWRKGCLPARPKVVL